jgi:hypothetical protein
MQGSNNRHATVLQSLQGNVPTARVVDTFASITLFEFRQIKAGTEVRTFTMHYSCARFGWQVLKHIAQGFNQRIVEGIAFGGTAQANHGYSAMHLKRNTSGARSFN